jgi:hypothetical protein
LGALRPGDGRYWANAGEMAWVLKPLEGLTRTRMTNQWEADGDSCFAWEIRKILASPRNPKEVSERIELLRRSPSGDVIDA